MLPRQRLMLRGRRLCLFLACCLVSLLPPLSDRSTATHLPSLNTDAIIVPNRIDSVAQIGFLLTMR
jgi:type II secretory pathway component PulM